MMYAHCNARGQLMHIGTRRFVELHDLPDPIVPVLVEEIEGDPKTPEVTHYGWQEFDRPHGADKGLPCMIQVRCGSTEQQLQMPWMILNICFPYGMKLEVDHGSGRMLALRITERTEDEDFARAFEHWKRRIAAGGDE